jgi:predicted transcriptional regulator
MKVRDIMTKDLTSCEKDATIRELIFILDSSGVPNMAIVDEEDKVIGFISEKDIIRACLPGYFDMLHTASFIPDMNQISKKLEQISDDPVEKHMRRDIIKVNEDDDDLQAAEIIIRKNVKNLPVLDREGHLVGQVKRIDLLRHLV